MIRANLPWSKAQSLYRYSINFNSITLKHNEEISQVHVHVYIITRHIISQSEKPNAKVLVYMVKYYPSQIKKLGNIPFKFQDKTFRQMWVVFTTGPFNLFMINIILKRL